MPLNNRQQIKLAIGLTIFAALFYSIMAFLVKLIATDIPESMIVFFRFSISLLWVLLVLGYKKLYRKHFTLKTQHIWLHLLRSVMAVISMLTLYTAFKYVPLADAISLAQTYTLFIPIVSLIFFGTKTTAKNWGAVLIGFTGVLIILKPFATNFNPLALLAIAAGIATAISFLGVHELAKHDQPYTIMFYFFPLTALMSGVLAIIAWKQPSLFILIILLLIGVTGTIYQEFFTRAIIYAPPQMVGPLLYVNIIFSGLFDWIFWHHIPSLSFSRLREQSSLTH